MMPKIPVTVVLCDQDLSSKNIYLNNPSVIEIWYAKEEQTVSRNNANEYLKPIL